MNQEDVKVMKDFWSHDPKLYLVGSHILCESGRHKLVNIEIKGKNIRISDIYWTYDDPKQTKKSLFICQKMPVINSNGTINFKKWDVIFFNDGPDDIYFTVYLKQSVKDGKIEVKPKLL